MSTMPVAPRPPVSAPSFGPARSAGAPVGGSGSSIVTIDPVRLLRRYWPILAFSVVIGGGLGFGAYMLLGKYSPKFTATVTFLVEPPTYRPTDPGVPAQGTQETERFTGTQVAQMTSDSVLQAAVNNPDVIRTTWAKPYLDGSGQVQTRAAAIALGKRISASPVSMTNLIRLNMTADSAEDAAVIANKVAQAYVQDLQKFSRSASSEKREALSKRLTQIEQQLRTARDSVTRIVEENNIDTFNEALSQEDINMRLLNSSLVELSKSQATLESLLEQGQAQLARAQTIVFPPNIQQAAERHPIVSDFNAQITALRVDVRSLRERGIGDDHPAVVQLKDRIRALEIELDKKKQEVLRQEFTAELDEYRKQIEAFKVQEKDLREQLTTVNTRREDMLRIKLQKDKLDADIERLSIEQTDVRKAVQDMETISGESAFDRVKIVRQAQTPEERSFPKFMIIVPMGMVLTGGLVGGLIVVREALDQRVRGPSDLSLIPRLNVLGMVPSADEDAARPKSVQTVFKDHPTSVMAESFRQIRSLLTKRLQQTGAKSLVVIGGVPESGTTTVVCNLGMAIAGTEERVLLIDGNLRRPALHKVFKLNDAPGLGDVLAGQASLEAAIQPSGVDNLSVLCAGSAASRALPERLGSESMARLLAQVSQSFDRVIIDAPPAIVSGDGLAIANRCDASALVVRAMSEKRGLVNRVRNTLGETRSEFMGVIVNAVRSSAGGYFRKNIEAAQKYQTAKD